MRISRSELASLPKEELGKILREAQKIKEAAKHRTLDSYWETAHPDQVEFHKASGAFRIRYFVGGNRSGKTTAGVVEDILLATGKHPYRKLKTPNKGVIIIQDFENHGKNILEPKMDEWCPKGEIVSVDRNQTGAIRKYRMKCGSTIDVLSHDQDVKVFEGADYDWAHFDEPPPKHIYTAIWRGLTDRGGSIHLTATPLTSPWMYQEYKKAQEGDPLRWFRFVSTKKNAKNLGEGDAELGMKRIEEFAALLDPSEKKARLDGEFAQMQGLIFKDFKREHHLIPEFKIPANWPIYETIDPHPHKPWAIGWIAITETGRKILMRCLKVAGTLEAISESILVERTKLPIRGENRPRILRCLIDNSASVPTWQKSNTDPTAERLSVRQELENMIGPMHGGTTIDVAPKNVAQKIDLFKRWLEIDEDDSTSNFYVFDNEENEPFVEEIENYVWDSERNKGLKDKPKKVDDDLLDAVMQVALVVPKELPEEPAEPIRMMEPKSWTGRR
jgi:phage terminase large subunit-like protein